MDRAVDEAAEDARASVVNASHFVVFCRFARQSRPCNGDIFVHRARIAGLCVVAIPRLDLRRNCIADNSLASCGAKPQLWLRFVNSKLSVAEIGNATDN
jgi:hypothetical protein